MSGIAGFADFSNDTIGQTYILDDMIRSLAHRGPDTSGTWASHACALGHRRLKVQDPAGGSQPMSVSIGGESFTIVYNGELYNAPRLREELISKGYVFRSHSDTEVLLNSYIQWGPSCPEKLNGIFAFAVWEEVRGRLFLCRDKLGVKPLFYAEFSGMLIFASEIKALLKHPKVGAKIDKEGISHLFALAPARIMGKTPFLDIFELCAGECMVFTKSGCSKHKYWQLCACEHTDSADKTAEKLNHLITGAVTNQLVSDVPVGTFLSGGLDSSIISAIAAREFKRRNKQLKTFSVDYTDNDKYFTKNLFQPDSDSEYIKEMVRFLGTDHYYYECGVEALAQNLNLAVNARDLPGMADVDVSLLLFCREIKKHATVALSGEGADEIFGGYPWFHNENSSDIFPWSNSVEIRKKLLGREFSDIDILGFTKDLYLNCMNEAPVNKNDSPKQNYIRKIMYTNAQYFMQTLLCRKDAMSMASGLEARVPFADHRIVQYAYNIPWEIMCFGGREKGILRLAFKDSLPENILYRKKSPYPKTHHPLYTALVKQKLQDTINDENNKISAICNMKYIQSLLNGKMTQPFFGQLMTGPQLIAFIIGLEYWLSEYNIEIV